MGKIIAVVAGKGGVGKTTTAIHMATYLAMEGHKTLLIDSDKQQSSSKWAYRRREYHPELKCPQSGTSQGKSVRTECADFAKEYDYVIIDSPGKESEELRAALTIANSLVIPMKDSCMDYETLDHMSDLIRLGMEINPNQDTIKIHALLSMLDSRCAYPHKEAKLIEDAGYKVCNTTIKHRRLYITTISDGLTVFDDLSNEKATIEMRNLIKEVCHE